MQQTMCKETSQFVVGGIVFAKIKGWQFWPAKIISITGKSPKTFHVHFLGTAERNDVRIEQLAALSKVAIEKYRRPNEKTKNKRFVKRFLRGIDIAVQALVRTQRTQDIFKISDAGGESTPRVEATDLSLAAVQTHLAGEAFPVSQICLTVELSTVENRKLEIPNNDTRTAETHTAETDISENFTAETRPAETRTGETTAEANTSGNATVETTTAEVPTAKNAPTKTYTGENSDAETPNAEFPIAEFPIAEFPIAEIPNAETATVETPTVETPTVETPTVETPTVETPTVETPTVETPTAETATVETPTTDTLTPETLTLTAENTTAENLSAVHPTPELPAAKTCTAEPLTAECPTNEPHYAVHTSKRVSRKGVGGRPRKKFRKGVGGRPLGSGLAPACTPMNGKWHCPACGTVCPSNSYYHYHFRKHHILRE